MARMVNVGRLERAGSAAAGGALVLTGLGRRSLAGFIAAAGGAWLLTRGIRGHCPVYERLGVDTTVESLKRGVRIHRTITIRRPPEDVYAFWRDLERLPRFLDYVESVEVQDGGETSRWVARVAGRKLRWDAVLSADEPGRRLAWRTLPGGHLIHDGTIELRPAPGGRGTELHVLIEVRSPGGRALGALSPLIGRLARFRLQQELIRIRQFLEVGEVATAEARAPAPGSGAAGAPRPPAEATREVVP